MMRLQSIPHAFPGFLGALGDEVLFRPELKPGMLEDMAMQEGRPLPQEPEGLVATP